MVPRRLFTCSPNEADSGSDGCTWPRDSGGATEASLLRLLGARWQWWLSAEVAHWCHPSLAVFDLVNINNIGMFDLK